MKVVINTCYGGFSLSPKAQKILGLDNAHAYNGPRNDEDLVRVVEELGIEAEGTLANLRVVEIPDNVEWAIAEYDGMEWVEEKHRTWG